MELSAMAPASAHGIDLRVEPSAVDGPRLAETVDGRDEVGPACTGSHDAETVVVHVQLRPRRSSTRRCLAALTALAARHDGVPFSLTGLGGDDRVVRVTVGIELGPRELIARFSDQAQAAYAFVDGLFTDLYDYMPVYVGEPSEAERAAAAGVLRAADPARHRTPVPRIPTPRTPAESRAELALAVPA